MTQNKGIYALHSRGILRVHGPDAADFLQNVFTNDITLIAPGVLQYNLLLTPQGQVLHDVFIYRAGDNDYHVDCAAERRDDLLRRMMMFRLRAKVEVADISGGLPPVTADLSGGAAGYADPRHESLGRRLYDAASTDEALPEAGYDDCCIEAGIPVTAAIRYGKDFSHEVNLDLLHAISWTKGCFIGQEVAARVYNRGLAKRRLVKVTTKDGGLVAGAAVSLLPEGQDIGELRAVSSGGQTGLGLCRLEYINEGADYAAGDRKCTVLLPDYMP